MQKLLEAGEIHDAEPVDPLSELRNELQDLREEVETIRQSYERDRSLLAGLLQSLRAALSGTAPTSDKEPMDTARGAMPRWEALKRAFPGRCADLIDTLISHGPLTTMQIATIMRADPRTVNQLIYKLNKAGGIEKNGGKFSLK